MISAIEKYFDRLWPICRSITGEGLRETLKILQEIIPLKLTEIPTGAKVFDWEIPKEWNISDAYIITPEGKKIANFKNNNLHVVNYSVPVNETIEYPQLIQHIYTLPDLPDAVPYITSYYKENWGFCLSHNEFLTLPKEGKYKVFIDSNLKEGSLTYGDLVLPGDSDKEILFSTYVCHPSMANNELSGPLVTAFLYQKIKELTNRKYTYRFVFVPETIGAIAYLNKNGNYLKDKLEAGFVITCCGDKGNFTYKRSKAEGTLVDRATEHFLKNTQEHFKIIDFKIGGSDERQYCSPGFNLPVGSLMRTMYKCYPEYHTSLDNKNFISFPSLIETIDAYFDIVRIFELNDKYVNKIKYGEPFLSKHNLYPTDTNHQKMADSTAMLLHFLAYADGTKDLIEIAEKFNSCILDFADIVETCKKNNLI